MSKFPAVFNLASLNGNNGFAINGMNIYGESGSSVSGAGDVNGDGIADVIIGAPTAGDNQAGQSYVMFGSKSGFTTPFNLISLNGNNGFAINGINLYDNSGSSVSGAGDVNGDGIADIIIGAPDANNRAGQSYVMFGSKSGFTTPFNLDNLNGNNGFAINGINGGQNGDQSGYSVSGAGDVNGDGIADIIIGAPGGALGAGQSYVMFGSKSGFSSPFNLDNLNGNNGFAINGINGGQNGDNSGSSVSGAGDVNGDGIADIIIGAPNGGLGAGKSYVIFGSKNGFTTPFNLISLNGNNGFAIDGINPFDFSGTSVSGAGDVNNDGIADIIIGAPVANNFAGQSYVVFGSKSGFTTPFSLTSLNGNNGFAINGINGGRQNGDNSGNSVSGAGDVNDDGVADIIIGAPVANNFAGQSYLVFGSKSGFSSPFNLISLNGNNGFAINGINGSQNGDNSGNSVSGAGDVNGDGIADIIIGAPDANNQAGYVIFGVGSPAPGASSSSTPTPSKTPSISLSVSLSSSPTASLSFGASPSNTVVPSHNIPGDHNKLSDGEIAGIAVGAAVGIGLLSAGIAWYGKVHGWWCAGEHADGYVGVDGGVN